LPPTTASLPELAVFAAGGLIVMWRGPRLRPPYGTVSAGRPGSRAPTGAQR
jgi:hypothetical protein